MLYEAALIMSVFELDRILACAVQRVQAPFVPVKLAFHALRSRRPVTTLQ